MPSANGGDSMKIMEDMRKDMKRYEKILLYT